MPNVGKYTVLSYSEFYYIGVTQNQEYMNDTPQRYYNEYERLANAYKEVVEAYNALNDQYASIKHENKALSREVKECKQFKAKFSHPIDKKIRKRVISLLKQRWTQKEIAEETGISASTVARIKKEEGIKKPKLSDSKK